MSVIHMGQDFLILIPQATHTHTHTHSKKKILERKESIRAEKRTLGSLISGRFVAFCVYAVLSTISLDGGFDDENKWRSGNLLFIDFSEVSSEFCSDSHSLHLYFVCNSTPLQNNLKCSTLDSLLDTVSYIT